MKTIIRLGWRMAAGMAGLMLCQSLSAVTFTNTPSSVSNTYNGTITLQVTGLTNGETVVVQKYLDANADGVVDAGDILVQQFNVTDGQASVFTNGAISVTNLNVPGDTDSVADQITAVLNFQNGDTSQNIIAPYLYVVSSPTGHFTAITNTFNVTNAPYSQTFSGNIVNNGTNVADAVVILFLPKAGGHLGTSVGGVLADNSGHYSIEMPAGTYFLLPTCSNFVAYKSDEPTLTLSNGQNITTNLTLSNATTAIAGQLVDATNSSNGLPGVFVSASDNGIIATGSTSSNGSFNLGVTSGTWGFSGDGEGLIVHGYIGYNGSTNIDSGTSGVIIPFVKATALFYGIVTNSTGTLLAGVDVESEDQNGYQMDGYTASNGYYYVGAIAGSTNDLWQLNISSSTYSNYLFAEIPFINQNGGTNLNAGQAIEVDFSGIPATNTITGTVTNSGGAAIAGVGVYASTTNGVYNTSTIDTDSNGNYSINVGNGVWSVCLNCCSSCSGTDYLATNYACPNCIDVTISNNNGFAYFDVIAATNTISGTVEDDQGHPIAGANVFLQNVNNSAVTTDSNGFYSFTVAAGPYDVCLNCCNNGGGCLSSNYLCPNPSCSNVTVSNANLTVNFIAPLATNRITGYVTNANGTPIVGVGVTASGTLSNGMAYSTPNVDTASNGYFAFNLPNGQWNVCLNCCSTCGNTDYLPTNYACPSCFSVALTNTNAQLNFTVNVASNIVSGTVQDDSGHPLQGVQVQLFGTNNGSATTDSNGFYTISGGPGPNNVCVDCGTIPTNHLCPSCADITLTNNATVNFIIPAANNQISGYVTNNSGTALVGIQVSANAVIDDGDYSTNSLTDTNGHYVFNVPNGSWSVSPQCCQFCGCSNNCIPTNYECPQGPIVNISGSNNGTASFDAIAETNIISGTVLDDNGSPLSGVLIILNGESGSATTGTNGFYSLNTVPGSVGVCVDCSTLPPNYYCPSCSNVTVSNAVTSVNFVVPAATNQITGIVTNTLGQTFAGIEITGSVTIGGSFFATNILTDGGGHYAFAAPNGAWTVCAECCTNCGNTNYVPTNYQCPNCANFSVSGSSATANFTLVPQLVTNIVSVSASPTNGGLASGGGNFVSGSSVTVTATANPGYYFTNWTIGGGFASSSNSYSFNVTSNVTVTANFVGLPGQISIYNGTNAITNHQTNVINFASAQQFTAGPIETFTISNTGAGALTLQTPGLPTGFTLVTNPPASVPTNSSATFSVQLITSSAGVFSNNVVITNNDQTNNPFVFPIAGTVIGVPQIQVFNGTTVILNGQSNAVNFGSIEQGLTGPIITFTVSNSGGSSLTVATPAVPFGYTLLTNPPATLAPAASGSFAVQLNTASASTFSGNIVIGNNTASNNPFSFPITGTVFSSGPEIQVWLGTNLIADNQTNPPVTFGSILQNQGGTNLTFTVSNIGGQLLTVGGISVPTNFTVTTNPPASIATGSNGVFTVQLDTNVLGVNSGFISITNGDTNHNPYNFLVTGSVNARIISLSGDLNFGGVDIGSSNSSNLIISNGGNVTLTVTNILVPAGFGVTFPTPTAIPAGTTQAATITFVPVAATIYSGAVIVQSDATGGADAVFAFGYGANGTAVLTIVTNGYGKVTPESDGGKSLVVGHVYTLTAKPNSGNLFSNWTGSIVTNKNPLTFKMEDSTVLEANFVTNPFLVTAGDYNGLFSVSNIITEATAGMLKNLTVNQANGDYTGTLLISGGSNTLKGTFGLDGQATNEIKRPSGKGGDLTVVMVLSSSSNSAPLVTGTINGTNAGSPWQASLVAAYATNVYASAQFTMLLPPDTNNPGTLPPTGSPGGAGYILITNYAGTATHPALAKATVAGALADGATFSEAVPVSQTGFVPIYANLYGGAGLLLGWINLDLTNVAALGVSGLTWIHPVRSTGLYKGGFTNIIGTNQIYIAQWTNSAFTNASFRALTNLQVLATLDDTNALTNFAVTISDTGVITGDVTGTVKGSINPKTGLLKVTFGKGPAATTGYGAVLLGTTNDYIDGYYLTKTNTAQAIKITQ